MSCEQLPVGCEQLPPLAAEDHACDVGALVYPDTRIDSSGSAPASEVGADGLIAPELVEELAKSAKLVPLVHPADAPPEAGYVPSKALADFVRCRDLTCRWPGCDRPAL